MPARKSAVWSAMTVLRPLLLLCLLLGGGAAAGPSFGHAAETGAMHQQTLAAPETHDHHGAGTCQGMAHCGQVFLIAPPVVAGVTPLAARDVIFLSAARFLPPGLTIGPARHPPRQLLP